MTLLLALLVGASGISIISAIADTSLTCTLQFAWTGSWPAGCGPGISESTPPETNAPGNPPEPTGGSVVTNIPPLGTGVR